jgi:hypothetical protein
MWRVPKRRFAHFYALGGALFGAVALRLVTAAPPIPLRPLAVSILLALQCMRRLYECQAVSIFSPNGVVFSSILLN